MPLPFAAAGVELIEVALEVEFIEIHEGPSMCCLRIIVYVVCEHKIADVLAGVTRTSHITAGLHQGTRGLTSCYFEKTVTEDR